MADRRRKDECGRQERHEHTAQPPHLVAKQEDGQVGARGNQQRHKEAELNRYQEGDGLRTKQNQVWSHVESISLGETTKIATIILSSTHQN